MRRVRVRAYQSLVELQPNVFRGSTRHRAKPKLGDLQSPKRHGFYAKQLRPGGCPIPHSRNSRHPRNAFELLDQPLQRDNYAFVEYDGYCGLVRNIQRKPDASGTNISRRQLDVQIELWRNHLLERSCLQCCDLQRIRLYDSATDAIRMRSSIKCSTMSPSSARSLAT